MVSAADQAGWGTKTHLVGVKDGMSAGVQVVDIAGPLVTHWVMGVTPLPRRGTVLAGRDAAARMLRVSYHPELARVVVSIWDHDICIATLRLAPEDVPELVRGLTASLVAPEGRPASGPQTVAIPNNRPPGAATA